MQECAGCGEFVSSALQDGYIFLVSSIEQITGAALKKGIQLGLPRLRNGAGVVAVLEREHGVDADDQARSAVEGELLWIEVVDGRDHLDAQLRRVESVAIGEGKVNSRQRLSVVRIMVGVLVDGDGRGREGHPGNISRIQRGRKCGSIEEWRGDVLKWHRGAAAHRDVGELQQLDAG